MVMVGADLCGIELRMLAHYLARYDNGRYADILLNGDIHATNAEKIGITRREVKTVTYAFLYGAGDEKIGLSFDPQLAPAVAKKKGKEIRAAFIEAIEGLDGLLKDIKKAAGRGYIKAIDNRKIKVDSPHKALNYLLQSSAGVIAKRWMVLTDERIRELQLINNINQLAFVHDELVFDITPQLVDDLKFLLELTATQSGEYYSLKVPINAESKSGPNWACTH
jgi:DNA polymerase I-like protein with 3'-5' exonuclease and polymerase domains